MTTQTEAYFTYAHARKSDNKIFYIGKGKQDRIFCKSTRNNYWNNTVAKHGFLPIKLAKWKIEQEAFAHEKFLIWCFKDMGIELVNMTDGGEGLSNPSKETRKKMSANNAMKRPEIAKKSAELRAGKKLPPVGQEAREKMSKAKKGVPLSDSHKKKLSEVRKGVSFSEEHRKNMSISAKTHALKGWETRRKNKGATL